jgi:hypothetical protein
LLDAGALVFERLVRRDPLDCAGRAAPEARRGSGRLSGTRPYENRPHRSRGCADEDPKVRASLTDARRRAGPSTP